MATAATQTVKISQTILLDIDFSHIESVRVVDVDLLIVLKDGQRLIVPEGAVRALMDNDFSINFKGRVFSVTSLMELQTLKSQRIADMGIAGKPGWLAPRPTPDQTELQRLDLGNASDPEAASQALSPDSAAPSNMVAQPARPPNANTVPPSHAVPSSPANPASTEDTSQARDTAHALDRAVDNPASFLASPGKPVPGVEGTTSLSASTDASSAPGLVLPTGISPMWKYVVGALGAGLAVVATRLGAKPSSPDALTSSPDASTVLSGALALGPFKEGALLKLTVHGVDASGQSVVMADTLVRSDASSKYSITLDGIYANYAGPILLVLTDADPTTTDFKSEATGLEEPLGQLTLRSAGYLESSGASTLNITPLTELAVRTALRSNQVNQAVVVPRQDAITLANQNVAQAFGLGSGVSVTSAPVKTVFDTGFNATDASLGTRYALVLAALSGVDSSQVLASGQTASDQTAQTLDTFAAHFVSTASAPPVATLSSELIDLLIQGALRAQPTLQTVSQNLSLNAPALLAKQIVESYATGGASKILALVGSSVTTVGSRGTVLEFHFDQPISHLSQSDVVFSQPNFTLNAIQKTDDKGMSWSAILQPPASVTSGETDTTKVKISFASSQWVGNSWEWTVDTTPPAAPRALTLAPANSLSQTSDSGISATDHLSNVKTPAVRVALNTQDAVAGDVVVLRQIGMDSDHDILDSHNEARNSLSHVLTESDIGTGWVDFSLNDLGQDGQYRLAVFQQDAAGNTSSTVYTTYTLDTAAPAAVHLTNLSAQGQIDFGPQTPLALVNAKTKASGFLLQGGGGERDCTISVAWGGKTIRQGMLINDDGTWAVLLDSSVVPADNRNTQLVITQVDAAGNVSVATTYTVEVNAAGVNARVQALVVTDESAAIAAGRYSVNAHDALTAGQSTDDTRPVVTVKLDRPLLANEIIQVFDTTLSGPPQPVFTLSGTPINQNGMYVWICNPDQWPGPLAAGMHQLSARVFNTYTLDTSEESPAAIRPAFVVQAFNFNQLLMSPDPASNLIPPDLSAGATVLDNLAVNKPILGGTLATALGAEERLGVYDTYQDREQFLGYLRQADLTAVTDSANSSTGAYTWRFAVTTPLANGSHSLSVRLESDSATPVVRMAMSQGVSVALPILSIAPAAVSTNGLSTDTGWSSTDNISNSRTPGFRLVFPTTGRRPGDSVTLTDLNALDASRNPVVVYTSTLTAHDISQGYADLLNVNLLQTGSNTVIVKTLKLMASIKGTALNSQAIKSAEPLIYVLDTVPPPAPVISLVTDTSYDAGSRTSHYITRVPSLTVNDYDTQQYKLQVQLKRNGISPTASAWQDSSTLPTLLVDGTQDGTWTVFARLVDVAGNVSAVTPVDKLGPGTGYLSFTLDTRLPLVLSTPTLLEDTSNSVNASFSSDRVTSNFHLRDAVPATLETYASLQSTAKLEYRVWLDGRPIPTQWYGSYLDALGAFNELTGDALAAWEQLDGQDDIAMTAMLAEGVYHVQRRQIDMAGNVSPESTDWTFTLDYKLSPLGIVLVNDTSINRRITSDVGIRLKRQGITVSTDSDPGSRWSYELTGYVDTNHSASNGISSTSSAYVAPTVDGYYTLTVTQTNKANVISASSLDFQRDTTAPDTPGVIRLWAGSDTHRGVEPDTVGVGDNVSRVLTPTFVVKLPIGNATARTPKAGDRLELYRVDLANPTSSPQLWGSQVLTQADLDNPAKEVRVIASMFETDQTYTLKTRWVDMAGNVSDWGPSVTYQLDTQALAPTIHDIQLPGVPRNFINHQSSVHFSGTGEPGSLLSLHWGSSVDHTTTITQSGTWELEVDSADFAPNTERLSYDSTVTVSLVDPAGNPSLSTSLPLAVNAAPVSVTAVIDQVSGIHATGIIDKGHTTDERLPLLSGHLSDLLPAAQRADLSDLPVVRVYDGETLLGIASVTGTDWTYQIVNRLTDGRHAFWAEVYDPLTLQTSVASPPYSIIGNALTLDALDVVHPSHWIISNTSRPSLNGTLKVALAPGESLAVYDRLTDGGYKKLGTVEASWMGATSDGLTWTFDMPYAMFGDHVYRVQVETTQGTSLMTLDQAVLYDFNSITLAPASDSGYSPDDNISQVKAPVVVIHLASRAEVGMLVKLRLNGSDLFGTAYQHTVTAQDKADGQFSMQLPNLWSQIGSSGVRTGDAVYTLSATVGESAVVSDLLYQLDTTAPTYTPSVSLQHVTGGLGGFTSDARLRASRADNAGVQTDIEEVQVLTTGGVEVLGWTRIDNFNQNKRSDGSAFTLNDGPYTLNIRATDLAGNIGQTGLPISLQLDTQPAQVLTIVPDSSAATSTGLQQDFYLNQTETAAGAAFRFKISFNEPVNGLTLDHLRLWVSGPSTTAPTLDSVTAIQPVEGFANDWWVTVTNLNRLTTGETLKLVVDHGEGVMDRALNQTASLTYTVAHDMTTDLAVSLGIAAVVSGAQSLLTTPYATSVTFNGASIRDGVQVSGVTSGVEAGQGVVVSLVNTDGVSVYTLSPTPVGDDGRWTAQLSQTGVGLGLGALGDLSRYALRATVQDLSGNLAQTSLEVQTRLSARITINQVIANNAANDTVLDYASTHSLDGYITSADKLAGQSGSLNNLPGFTVSGDTSLDVGRTVSVQLVREGATSGLSFSAVVDTNHRWSARFTANQVRNLSDGGWQLIASGTDADGNTAVNPERMRAFIVDTRASVNLDTVGADLRVNASDDGASLIVSGNFADIEPQHTLNLSLHDTASTTPTSVVWSRDAIALTSLDGRTGTWRCEISLSEWDELLRTGVITRDAHGVANLSFTATTADTAGNVAVNYAAFSLDRDVPAAPVLGAAVRQIAGDTTSAQSATSLYRATTLADAMQGVILAPHAPAPLSSDIATITVDATTVEPMTDQWRLGSALWFMSASVTETPLTLNDGAAALSLIYAYDTANHRLIIQQAGGGAFTPQQVQQVLGQLAWVNTSSDATLEQSDRVFTWRFIDAYGNVSTPSSVTFAVDTQAPLTLTQLSMTTAVTGTPLDGTVIVNSLNASNTALQLSATIGAGEATGGYAEFYIGSTRVGTSELIGESDTVVSYTTRHNAAVTSSAAELQNDITSSGVLRVKLFDQVGNVVSAEGPMLLRDVTPPDIVRMTSSTPDGAYKAGDSIALSAHTSEAVADDRSTLVATLNTRDALQFGSADRTVILNRDATHPTLFVGSYTVQPGDTSADLAVSRVSLNSAVGAQAPRDAAGNALNLDITSLPVADTLSGSKSLVIDTTAPRIVQIYSSTPNGTYKAADAITLNVLTNESIANDGSTLLLTLNTGSAGQPEVPNRTVTLTRDSVNSTLFTGVYRVQAGDTSADLSVTRVTWDPVLATPAPVDAAGNALNWAIDSLASAMTLAGSSDIAIDTTAPTLLTQVAISTAVTGTASDGVVAPNTLNSTNTAMKFTATIGAGEATGGYAEFYVGNVRMGTSRPIGVTDTTVSYVTELAGVQTATAAALQSKIADGGLVSVKLYDQAGNFITAGGPTLMRDVTPPVVLSNVMVTTAVTGTPGDGTVVVNTLNGTNTALKLSATIGVGEATGGYAEFYVGNSRIGTSRLITGTDTTVEYITNINGVITTTAQALQSLIATGGTVSVRLYDEARNLLSATGRDLQFDITAPSALDLVSGGVVNTSSTEYYSAAIAGTDTPLMPRVGAVRETDIATITVIVSGADALNDILKFGAVELALNSTARSGSASVGNVNVDWTYSPSQVLTFTKAGGDAWTTADIQTLENGLKFRTYLTAAMGTRLFGVTHIDLAGNASVLSTQSVAVDAAAPNAPDLDAISSGVQRTSVTYYGLANLGANKPIAALVDASQDDIALITMTVGGVADSRDQLVVGTASQVLNPSALASGSNVTINGVSGVDWSYSVGKVLTLTRTGGGAFSAAQVRDIERGLSFNATAGATAGARTFTLQNTDLAGNASATSLQTVLVDVVVPTINTVDIKGYTPLGVPKSILGVGDQVRVELTLSEGVIVDTTLGTPSYRIVLDTGGTVSATYVSGSGTSTLVFSYTVAPSNSDSNGGITPAASPLNFNGGTVLDLAGNACSVASLPSPAVNTLRVDTAAPSPVTNMTVLDANMPASTNGTVKALNSSLFQLMSARGVHYGFNNTSAITISYRQDDGSSLTFSFNDSTSYTGTGQLRTGVLNAFASSTLGQAGLFDFSIDGSSGSGFSSNGSGSPSSSGDGVTRMMWMYLQAKPGKVVDASKLTFSNSFYYWLPSTAVAGNPGATAVTYDAAVGWGNNTPTVPGNASVNTGLGLSTTQLAVGGHINSGSVSGNGWLYQYQGLVRSTPTSEPVVDTLADNRLVFDFSSAGGIAKSTVLSTVSAGEGRLTAADALTVLNLWRGRFTPNAGALPTFAELFGAATTFNVSAQDITSTGGEGYMVSYQYVTGSTTLVSKVTIDLGATSVKSKLLGGRFTFGSTVLKLPNAWATDGGTQVNPQPTFDITLPAGVEEGSVITLYDGTTSTGIVIGTKFITAAEVARGFASLAVSPDTPFANTSFGVVTHVLSAKVTDNAGNVATNDGFYNYAFVDGTGPAVRAVRVWGANAAGTAKTTPLVAGDQVMVTLVWDDAPVVTGVPTYALSINGVTKTATYQSTNGKDMVLSYLVTAADSSLGVTATATALTLGVGVTIQDVLGKSASLATPVVAAIDSPVVIANPRGELTGEQAQALAWGASQPTFALSYDGALAQVGDQLVLMENGVKVGSRVLTSSDMGAGQHTLNVIADSSLVSGIHAITFQYQDNTGAVTPYKVNGTPVTEYVSVGAHASVPALTLDALNLDNEGGQAGRSLSDWSLYQSTSDLDLVFTGTVDQAATVTVYATSTTTGVMQTVGAQQVLANSAFTISETAFSLAPDVYAFKVVAQNSTGQVAAVSTGPVGVFATSTANDTVLGTAGNDRINVGEGNNTVSTGHGQDVVYLGGYGALASNSGTSTTTITDFKLGQDKIDLTSVFTPGTVNTSNFMQFVSQSVSNGDTTLTIDSNGSAAGGTNHSVVLKNVSQVPLDSSVFNFIVL